MDYFEHFANKGRPAGKREVALPLVDFPSMVVSEDEPGEDTNRRYIQPFRDRLAREAAEAAGAAPGSV
jgi:hypothetical protein